MKEKLLSLWFKRKKLMFFLIFILLLSIIAFPVFCFLYQPDIDCIYLGEETWDESQLQDFSWPADNERYMGKISSPEEAAQAAYTFWNTQYSREYRADNIHMPYLIVYLPEKDIWQISSYESPTPDGYVALVGPPRVLIRAADGKILGTTRIPKKGS